MKSLSNLNFKGDVLVYLIASIFTAGLSFIFTIFLTYLITPSEIGKIETFVSFSSLLTVVILFGSSTHLVKFYSEKKENHFQTVFNGITVNSILISILILSISSFLDFENSLGHSYNNKDFLPKDAYYPIDYFTNSYKDNSQ